MKNIGKFLQKKVGTHGSCNKKTVVRRGNLTTLGKIDEMQ